MAYANGKITAPVNQYDVQQALSISSPHWNDLCSSDKINKWARYKPERIRDIFRTITFFRRKANNFSLEIPFCNTYPSLYWRADMMNKMVWDILTGTFVGWEYLKPQGDRTAQGEGKEYFRITDFCRNPQDNDDPTPVALQGYNHGANSPFSAFLDMIGATENQDSDGTYYDINYELTHVLKITFCNSGGDDLHLQDFIDLSAVYSDNIAWRPVLQVFNGDVILNSSNPYDREQWYDRDNFSPRDMEIAGDAITTDSTGTWSVTIDLTDSIFTPYINNQTFFHLCVGVGCTNPDCSSWGHQGGQGSENALFIVPYTQQQFLNHEYPFYFRFKIIRNPARTLQFTAMQYFRGGYETWANAGGTAPYFEILSNATGAIRLTMTITKNDLAVDFVPQYGQPDSGYKSLRIKIVETIAGISGSNTFYLQPSVGPTQWQNVQHAHVPAGNTSETVMLYANTNVSTIQAGAYANYHVYVSIDDGDYTDISQFSIHRTS